MFTYFNFLCFLAKFYLRNKMDSMLKIKAYAGFGYFKNSFIPY
jgi:hypothetical protein